MNRQEIMTTRIGEMLDMIACLSIFNGAKPKHKKEWTYDEAVSLR